MGFRSLLNGTSHGDTHYSETVMGVPLPVSSFLDVRNLRNVSREPSEAPFQREP